MKAKIINRPHPDRIPLSEHPMVKEIGRCNYYYSQSTDTWAELRMDYLYAKNEAGDPVGMDGISHAVYALNKLSDIASNLHIMVIANNDKYPTRVKELIALGIFNMQNGLRRLIADYDNQSYKDKGCTGPKWWEARSIDPIGHNQCWHYHQAKGDDDTKGADRHEYGKWIVAEAMDIYEYECNTEEATIGEDNSPLQMKINPNSSF